MKIKSVELHQPHHQHPEDATCSTSSIEDSPPVDYDQTVASLTQALTELHMELRYRTSENEALLATASSLSDALQESDRLLQDKSLECERLKLKLQMVTFVERNDESCTSLLDGSDHDPDGVRHGFWTSSEEIELNDSIQSADLLGKVESSTATNTSTLSNKPKKKKSTGTTHKERPGQTVEEPSSKSTDTDKNHGAAVRVHYSGPVSVDDFDEDSPEIGPRQAHFYNVMLERDKALSSAKKLKKELSHAKGKVKELQAKLDKSKLLVEISYRQEEEKKQRKPYQHSAVPVKSAPSEQAPPRKKDTQVPESSSSPSASTSSSTIEVSRKAMTRQWLRKAGVSVRKKEVDGDEPFQTLVTDDEKLSSKWHNKFQGSKTEAAYLDAIAGNDADRAGGHESIRFQL